MAGHPIVTHSVAQECANTPMPREDLFSWLIFRCLHFRTRRASVPNLGPRAVICEPSARRNGVGAVACGQSTSTGINKVIPADACISALSQPSSDLSDAVLLKKVDPFVAPFLRVLALENTTRDAPEDQFRMRLGQSRRRRRLVQFPQFVPNAKQLHGYAHACAFLLPVMPVGLIQRFESPDAPTGTEEDARADQRAGLFVALPISPPGKADRHIDHGAFVRAGKQSGDGA